MLGEDSLKDVDGFIAARDSPLVIELEAQRLLNDQQELGMNFDREEELPVNRMTTMEGRDKSLGGAVKRNAIKEMIRKEKIEFLAIQETKMEIIPDSLCYNIWGGEDCQWVYLPSVGNSGGMLSIWSKSFASLIFYFSGDSFIGVCLEWGALKKRCFVVNVYSKCDLSGKRNLWETLVTTRKNVFGSDKCC
ncbi:endonuclease/exonuclease/phosphatase family protein [Trifolium medium]|uniref:Endonuclease/exonuclease/phosphatase family protein n=1 Tax=Trifolium medium TaxID=97028 RepID=A0A392NFH4_9FABA|nr:endonuclease/exonuclease/phosphatase family protein [Trifolium medium]